MTTKMLSTGQIIAAYLENNGKDIFELAKASQVEAKTIYRLINDETKLSIKVAFGMNMLIPEISPEFLVTYDAKYQLQKETFKKQYDIDNLPTIIDNFKLRKLYRDYYRDNIRLFDIGRSIFGIDNLRANCIDAPMLSSFVFSKAKNPNDDISMLWLVAAYQEYQKITGESKKLKFNSDQFKLSFDNIRQMCGTTDIKSTLFNMKMFCEATGINFYYRPSIPNSRVKAVSVKDRDGYVYIFVSDLFKCVENLWLSFIHECAHIFKDDLLRKRPHNNTTDSHYENFIDEEAMKFFIGNSLDVIKEMKIVEIAKFAKKIDAPVGIVAEIYRFVNHYYSDNNINSYVHYFKSGEIRWSPPF